MKKLIALPIFIIIALVFAACAPVSTPAPTAVPTKEPVVEPTPMPTEEPKPEPQTIVDVAVADGRFTTLVAAVQAADLVETLQGEGPFTVFAPTDDAFAKLPTGTVEALLGDIPTLTNILLYHVVSGKVMAEDVVKFNVADTVSGIPVLVNVMDGKVYINNAQVVITDVEASNGVIHVVDTVILPPKDIVDTAVEDGRFTTLVAAVQAAGLVDTLKGEGPFTVFAPTDDAFAKLPEGTVEALLADIPALTDILTFHVAEGRQFASDVVALEKIQTLQGKSAMISLIDGKAKIENAEIIVTDVLTSNGVIHVIDAVILPPKDIVETAVADGRFTTLVAAVQAAGLVDTLKGEGPFTVFAPTDDAFAKLPTGTIEALLADIPTLTDILTYHVAEGRQFAADVVALEKIQTLQGKSAMISLVDGKAMIDNAEIIITDVLTSNGVIHVIDAVILPPKDIVETAVADGRFTTLVAAVEAAGLVDTLKGEGPFTVFAPTDDAFAKLPEGTVADLLKNENLETLKNILLYHVVAGKVMAADVVTLESAETVLGQNLTIKVQDGKVYLNDTVQVIITDIETYNGVIHVIDNVLLPAE